MTKNDNFGIEKIDTKKNKVFDYYKSGDNSKGTNIILKYISISFFFLLLVCLLAYLFYGGSDKEENTDSNISVDKKYYKPNAKDRYSHRRVIPQEIKSDYENFIYMSFTCINNECKFKDTTNYFDISIIPTLAKITNSSFFPLKIQSNTKIIKGAVIASPILQNMFKERQNEKSTRHNNSLDLPLISK